MKPETSLISFFPQDHKAEWLLEGEKIKTEFQSQLNDAHHKLRETETALAQAEAARSDTNGKLEELQRSSDHELQNLEKELKQALMDRDAAARKCYLNTSEN